MFHPSVIGPHVQRLANLPVDVAIRQPARGGVLADLVRQVLHSPPAALKRVSLVSAEDHLHRVALEARDAPFGAALMADLR